MADIIEFPHKEDCPGCLARRDSLGRMQPGHCGDDCLMRQWRNEVRRRQSKFRTSTPR